MRQLHKLDGMLDEIIDAVKQGTQSGSSNSLSRPLRIIFRTRLFSNQAQYWIKIKAF